MNYATLKTMIEGLIKSYSCPECHATAISEKNVDIIGAAGNTVNIDMKCPSCKKHYMARMEVVGLNLSDNNAFSKGSIENLKLNMDSLRSAFKNIATAKQEIGTMEKIPESANIIKDEEIIDLSRSLKSRKLSVNDLLSDK